MKYENIKIYYRPLLSIFKTLIGPKIHPILQDQKGTYYELDKNKFKTVIHIGTIPKLNKKTRYFFKTPRKPKEIIKVDKAKFLKSIKEFKKLHEGKIYNPFNFKTNCIGFKNFVIEKSNT